MGQALWPAFYDVTKGRLCMFSEKWRGAEVKEDERCQTLSGKVKFSKY